MSGSSRRPRTCSASGPRLPTHFLLSVSTSSRQRRGSSRARFTIPRHSSTETLAQSTRVRAKSIELDDEAEAARIPSWPHAFRRRLVGRPELDMIPYIGGTPAGTPRRAEAVWTDRTLHVVRRPARETRASCLAGTGSRLSSSGRGRAIKLCFDRSPEFVTEVVEENFTLAARGVVETEVVSHGPAERRDDSTDRDHDDSRVEAVEQIDSSPLAGADIKQSVDDPSESGQVPDDATSDEPLAKHRRAAIAKPAIIDRFARAHGFVKDGDDRFSGPTAVGLAGSAALHSRGRGEQPMAPWCAPIGQKTIAWNLSPCHWVLTFGASSTSFRTDIHWCSPLRMANLSKWPDMNFARWSKRDC